MVFSVGAYFFEFAKIESKEIFFFLPQAGG